MLDTATIPTSYIAINFVLAMVMYTLLARFLLMIVFDETSGTVFWKVFRQISDPLVRGFQLVTPAVIPAGITILLGVMWVVAARLLLLLTYLSFGWLTLGAPA